MVQAGMQANVQANTHIHKTFKKMVLFEKNEVLLKGFQTLQLSFKCFLQMHGPYLSCFQSRMGKSSKAALVSQHSVSSVIWRLAFTPLLSQYFANPSPRFKIRFDNWQSSG